MVEPGEIAKVPESPFNSTLLQTLRSLDATLTKQGYSPFKQIPGGLLLESDGKNLVTVTSQEIVVIGQSFQDKINTPANVSENNDINLRFSNFLEKVSDQIVRLNHLGISYFCDNIEEEKRKTLDLAKQAEIPLHEEPAVDKEQNWLFLGTREQWENPLFEVVLNEGSQIENDFWRPHFQIDLDTTMSLEEIRQVTDEYVGQGFIQWQLDVPVYGTVLVMGVIGKVGETKIALGLGINKRPTEKHRKYGLKTLQ